MGGNFEIPRTIRAQTERLPVTPSRRPGSKTYKTHHNSTFPFTLTKQPPTTSIKPQFASNPSKDSNFVGRVKGLKVFIGNFTYECNFMILEDTTSIIDHHLGEVVFGKPFARNTGLVYDQEEGTVTFEKDNEKITFMMPHKMEASNHIDFKDINTDSIPPFVLGSNDDRGKTYYSDSLTLGPEYREDESISKEIRHLMKLEREAKRHKGEVTLYLMRRSLEVLRKFHWTILG
ncbi:protein kinase-like domain, concanavalin A-like lectin/glucanase domain protein [Tanacetum coccineum]